MSEGDLQQREAEIVAIEDRLVPRMQPRSLLFMAAMSWLLVGISLFVKGGHILAWHPIWLLVTLLVGTLKSLFVLDRIARRNVQRLQGYGGPVFVGALFAPRTWLVIAVMILLGRVLRLPGLAPELSGFFSLAVGWGLVMASRLSWQGWLAARKDRS